MRYLITLFSLCLVSCETEVECCSYTYWTTYNSSNTSLSVDDVCSCCYDLAGRETECQ